MDGLTTLKKLGFIPRTILDIGAYHGNWSKEVNPVWPSAKIYAFEANSDHFLRLSKVEEISEFEIVLLGNKDKKSVNYFCNRETNNSSGSDGFFTDHVRAVSRFTKCCKS